MNKDIMHGKWKLIRGGAKKWWSKVPAEKVRAEELNAFDGERELNDVSEERFGPRRTFPGDEYELFAQWDRK